MKQEQLTLELIKKYSKNKTVLILGSLLVSGFSIIIGCLFSFLEGIGIISTDIGDLHLLSS